MDEENGVENNFNLNTKKQNINSHVFEKWFAQECNV